MSFSLLPVEMIENIFRHLNDLNEILKCRRLNKRCRQAVDGIRIDSLSVQNSDKTDFANYKTKPKNVKFRTKNLHFHKSKVIKRMLSRLRILAIWFVDFKEKQELQQFLEYINELTGLEHLLILNLFLGRNNWSLQFDHIKSLSIHNYYDNLILTAPKLTELTLLNLSSDVNLINTNAITHLVAPGDGRWNLKGYSKDKIEYLVFIRNPTLSILNAFISTHPALKELQIQLVDKATALELLKQKRIAQNLNLVFYLSGFPVRDLDDVEQLFGVQQKLKNIAFPYLIANFERIHSVNWLKRVNYSDLIGYSDQLPVDAFLSKFNHVEQVEVEWEIESEAKFTEFLKHYKKLKKLTIMNSPLSGAFYENLHTVCANLTALDIETTHQFHNVDFLLKHRRLRELTINRELDFEFINRFIQPSPSGFYLFRFQRKGIWVELSKTHNVWNFKFKSYIFTCCNDLSTPFDFSVALKSLFDLF